MAKQQTYPKADATTQRFQGRYPGSRMDTNCGVLHTTETTGWPGYAGGATAPNLTARPNMGAKRLDWRQHFDMDRSSRALQNDAGGVETNTLNAAQVELVGTCDPRHRASWNGMRAGVDYIYWPDAPDWALDGLAEFLRWCESEHGIPIAGVKTWLAYPASYGQSNPNRLTFAQWRNLYGWCGHQHVPENDHGDPGNLDFARVLELAKPAPAKPPRKRRPAKVREAVTAINDQLKKAGKTQTARLQRAKRWLKKIEKR